MPFISVPNSVEIVVNGACGGQTIANVIGATYSTLYTQAQIDALSSVVDAWVASDYLPLVNNAVSYVETHVRGLNSIIDIESIDNTSAGPGTASGSGMPANASFVITMRSGKTGRSARGRWYMWPYSTAHLNTTQTVTSTYGNAAAAALTNLLAIISAVGATPSVISRRTLGAPRAIGLTTPILTASARNLDVDSMRHRLLRGH